MTNILYDISGITYDSKKKATYRELKHFYYKPIIDIVCTKCSDLDFTPGQGQI